MTNHLQDRDPPAYQEYASALISNRAYWKLNLQERGLLWAMKLECWVHKSLPNDPLEIALIIRATNAEVSVSLDSVMAFFAVEDGEIVCPELNAYKNHLAARKAKQVSDGQKGGLKSKGKRLSHPTSDHTSDPSGVLVQSSTEKQSQEHAVVRSNKSTFFTGLSAHDDYLHEKDGWDA